ncbi:MAG: hypothetical protein R2882_04820 [Gemmatimonadales bacterium]
MKLLQTAGLLALGCAAAAAPGALPAPAAACPPSDTLANRWVASVVIDDRVVAEHLPARREQEFPETWALEGPDPEALTTLPAERIDLLQFMRGAEAEAAYHLCPGGVP